MKRKSLNKKAQRCSLADNYKHKTQNYISRKTKISFMASVDQSSNQKLAWKLLTEKLKI